jgi:hypothetical protein
VSARLSLFRKNLPLFIRAQWPEILWALFLAALVGIATRSWVTHACFTGMALAFQWRLWVTERDLTLKLWVTGEALKKEKNANRILAGAVESSSEYIVEQKMHYEHDQDFGPVVWIDGVAYPVDAEHEARS